LHVSPCCRAAM